MAFSKTRVSDGVEYGALLAFSPVLAEISNTAVDFALSEKTFWVPAHQTAKVFVYVLEFDYTTSDVCISTLSLEPTGSLSLAS